jgi:hypothetical protein
MKKVVAVVLLGATLAAATPAPAHANAAVNAALALGAFAVFNQLFVGPALASAYYRPVYVAAPPVVYSAPVYVTAAPAYYPPPAPAIQREVIYPTGRYVLYGDGVTVPYQWVWVPNAPSAPPAAPPAR